MRTETLTREERPAAQARPLPTTASEEDELGAAARRQVKRVRRLKIHVVAWTLGTILFTALWVLNEWQANGALESFGHEGNPGQWNPTLWALGVGIWGLIVGIMALRVHFEWPPTVAEIGRATERLNVESADAELGRFTRAQLERIGRLRFHVAAWVLGMIVLTPLWALIEWQDNGGFERFSGNSEPGAWEPWIVYVGGIWALVIAVFALSMYVARPAREAEIKRYVQRLR